MKSYFEIYPIEVAITKANKLLSAVAKAKPCMYAKTKERYRKLAQLLFNCIQLIAEILGEDLVSSTSPQQSVSNNINTSQHSQYPAEISYSSSVVYNSDSYAAEDTENSDTSEEINTITDSSYTLDEADINNQNTSQSSYNNITPFISTQSNKESTLPYSRRKSITLNTYDEILKEGSTTDFGYVEVNECAKLLYTWFHSRFITYGNDPQFHYHPKFIAEWVAKFVLMYGVYYSSGKGKNFAHTVQSWSNSLSTASNSKYAVPYFIFQVDKSDLDNQLTYTMAPIVIYDILMNKVYYKLAIGEVNDMLSYLDPNLVMDYVQRHNPELKNSIRLHLARQQQLIAEVNLTATNMENWIDEQNIHEQ